MSYTGNLNLLLTPEADTSTTFKAWRVAMNGESNSNMMKIDTAYGDLDDAVRQAQAKVDAVSAKVFGGGDINTWADVQAIVRAGAASQYFNIGDQLIAEKFDSISASVGDSTGISAATVDRTDFLNAIGETKAGVYVYTYDGAYWRNNTGEIVNLTDDSADKFYGVVLTGSPVAGDTVIITVTTESFVFDIIGIDHDTPSNTSYTHSMTLQLEDVLEDTMIYDPREAFYYADEGLSAGTYHFTVTEGQYASDNNKTFEFTLSSDAPAGSQLVFTHSSNSTFANSTINVFNGATNTIAAQTATLTQGSSGTNLGTISNSSSTTNFNYIRRALMGNNLWSKSWIRQWLNSDEGAFLPWTPQSNFDRPFGYVAGWLHDFDQAFINVLGSVVKTTQKGVTDGYGLETTDDKVFLLSRAEVDAGAERSADGAEGTVYAYYAGASTDETKRIKSSEDVPKVWWLRTALYSAGYSSRNVSTAGSATATNACSTALSVAPACAIV